MKRAVLAALLVLAAASHVRAGEKQFGYVYEPATLPPGQVELEQWITPRLGKAGGVYSQFDLRSEIEVGVVDDLQTSIYINFSNVHAVDARSGRRSAGFLTNANGERSFSELSFHGISNEWVWKLSDPVADAIGVAAYVELETNGAELEIEEKLLLGKTWGPLTLAANLIFEQDWRAKGDEPTRELHFSFTMGLAYKIPGTPLGVGLEFRQENTLTSYTKYDHSVFSLGPNLHFYREHFWATLTVLPQIASATPSFKGFDYDAYEALEVRLIVGVEF
jgi:hypothetical protein